MARKTVAAAAEPPEAPPQVRLRMSSADPDYVDTYGTYLWETERYRPSHLEVDTSTDEIWLVLRRVAR